jgi:hypothetical protein
LAVINAYRLLKLDIKVPLFINIAKKCQKPVEIIVPVSKRSLTAQRLVKNCKIERDGLKILVYIKGTVNPHLIYHGLLLKPKGILIL